MYICLSIPVIKYTKANKLSHKLDLTESVVIVA